MDCFPVFFLYFSEVRPGVGEGGGGEGNEDPFDEDEDWCRKTSGQRVFLGSFKFKRVQRCRVS